MKPSYKYLIHDLHYNFRIGYCMLKKFFETQPYGSTSEATLTIKQELKGCLSAPIPCWMALEVPEYRWRTLFAIVSNWVFGGVASDDAHKGSTDDDQSDAGDIEKYQVNSANLYLEAKWEADYIHGIQRANDVIRIMANITSGPLHPLKEPK